MQAPLSPLVDKGAFAISALLIVPYIGQQRNPSLAIEALPPLGGRGVGIFFISTRYCILFFLQYNILYFFSFLHSNKCSIIFERLFAFCGRGLYTGIMG